VQRKRGSNMKMNNDTISKLFERMNHIFGFKFSSTYGESALTTSAFNEGLVLTDTAETWSQALAQFSDDQITTGLRLCLSWDKEWSPDLRDFVKLCKTKPPPPIYRPALESDELIERRKQQYKSGMANIREILNKNQSA